MAGKQKVVIVKVPNPKKATDADLREVAGRVREALRGPESPPAGPRAPRS